MSDPVYKVWLISDNGEGVPQELADWYTADGNLELRLSAFANNAVIQIEPRIEIEP